LDITARNSQLPSGGGRYRGRMGVSFESGSSEDEEQDFDRSVLQQKNKQR